eukprot:1476548-Pleurochrysis_carterae.AAC.1
MLSHRDGPIGFPPLASFAKSVEDKTKERFDKDKMKAIVDEITISRIPQRFTEADITAWASFWT